MLINSAYIEISNYCNLNCRGCYNSSGVPKKKQELSLEQLVTVWDRLISMGVQYIILSGGEPTLHSQWEEIIEEMRNRLDVCSFGIVTNGTTLNQSLLALCADSDKVSVQVSLDGSNEEVNAMNRGAGSFAPAFNTVKKLANVSSHSILKMVVTKQNIHDIPLHFMLAAAYNMSPSYAFINKSGNAATDYGLLCPSPKEKSAAMLEIARLSKETGVTVIIPKCSTGCPFANESEPLDILIKSDGSIQPCQTLYHSAYSLGNILYDPLETIAAAYQRISAMARERLEKDYGCGKCIVKGLCKKGCPAMAVDLYSDFMACDGDCEARRLQFVAFELKDYIHEIQNKAL